MVKLQDVHKVYDNGTKALKGVSLTIENGEFVFVVGPSGSGKSTIIKMLIAETKPTSGKVLINGFDIGALRQREIPYLRRTVGVVFQDFRLIDNKTVYENVAFVMRAVGAPMKVVKKRVPYVLDLVGVLHKARRLPSELSGGEQQRVAIARALVNNPDIVIADEPTGNLDPARSLELMMLFEKINALGTTVVVVTHEKVLVNQFEKRVIAIDGGMVIGDRQGGYYEERYPGIYIPEDEPEQGEQTPETAEDAAPAYVDEPEETADAYEAYAFAEHEEPAEAEEPAEQEAEVDE